MFKKRTFWLIGAIAFDILVIFLVLYAHDLIINRSEKNSNLKIDHTTLIADAKPIIQRSNREVYRQRVQQWREQQVEQKQKFRHLREQRQQRFQRIIDRRNQERERVRQQEILRYPRNEIR